MQLSHHENTKCMESNQTEISHQQLKPPHLTIQIFSFLNQTHISNAITGLQFALYRLQTHQALQTLYLNQEHLEKLSICSCFGLLIDIKAIFLFSFYAGSSLSSSFLWG